MTKYKDVGNNGLSRGLPQIPTFNLNEIRKKCELMISNIIKIKQN